MKIFKKLLLIVLFLLIVSGGIACTGDENSFDTNDDETIRLNLQSLDLIADITDNEKYLNKDLFGELKGLDDNDNINIIVTLDKNGLIDSYSLDNKGYVTLGDYASSRKASASISDMNEKQQKLASELLDKKYINSVNHSYTTLLNGFSAETTYGQFKKLVKAGYDVKFTISEVYAKPKYETTSTDSYSAVTNYVDVYETGIFNSSNVGYDGSNTAVAILDSGFDIHHTVFQNMPDVQMISIDDVEEVFYDSKAYGYHKNMKVQDVYLNAKIPFAYDYADKDPDVAPYDSDHGTHVAGIIGGKDDVITGVAINTQLVLMKVFGDINNGAIQDDILAALEDAILLGVDAINLSLGSACGFSRSSDNEYINVVYDKIEDAGISLVVAASNDYSSGYGGENSNTNKASNPDSATVGSPGTYGSTIAVASISGVKSKYIVDDNGYTFFFNNANDNAGEPYDFYDMLFEKLNSKSDKIELEYVTVPGVGKKVNYSSIDVEGKIALVKRGDISFEEKAQVALSQGAIGCIIYNNIAGEVYMNAGMGLKIALCSISKDDGEYLASKGSGTLIFDKSYLAGPFMSQFSSWGPVSDLSLKPEITAHGGSILSSVPGGGYDEISGTSMACPNLCGVIILVKQALKERYPEMTASELTNMANSLLMSTGTIILDQYGNPYSPRKQGAGLGNLKYAVDTLAYLSVEGQTKPKLELKDDPEETGVYELVFNVHNTSNKELKYRLTNFTMTESLSTSDPEYVAEKAYMLNPNTSASVTGDGNIDGEIVTVNPNGVVTINYRLELTDEEIDYIRRSFINGMYVEGFAVLQSLNEDEIDLSIPFLAFFGDWTVAPMFDKTYYEVESEKYNGSIDEDDKLKADYYATTPLGTYYYSYIIPLGSYVYEMDEDQYDKIPASEEHAAIGYNIDTINGITTVYAGLLRNAKKMTTVIKNADTGEIVYEHVKYDEHKAYFSGSIIPGYDIINITAAEMGLQNNTKYTFSMQAELDYGDGGLANNLNNTFEFSFYVDYQAPVITDAQFYTKYDKSAKEYRYYVDVYVYDNHYAQSIRPFTLINDKLVSLSEYVIPIYSEKGEISKVTVEITDYMDLLQYGKGEQDGVEYPLGNGLGFFVDDYALNQAYTYVTLPGTNSPEIGYKDEYISDYKNGSYQFHKDIYTGDTLDLTQMLTTTDKLIDEDPEIQASYFANLEWLSSDESVIKVNDGKIEAVGKGTALITCITMNTDGFPYQTILRIKVRESKTETNKNNKLTDIKFTYFETLKAFVEGPEVADIGETGDTFFFTEKPDVSLYPSEQIKIAYELEPWNLKDYKLIWSTTNDKVATVDENGVVTALKEGSATITLKVEVDGRVSSLMATTRINVKSEFVIEGQTLTAYKGMGGRVVIPADKGILYIGSFAFSLYTTDYEIKIEEDDYDAAKTPASNDTVTSVVIPASVKEVYKYAFYNCTALESVTFLKDDQGNTCTFIKEYAFANNKSLKTINLENIMLLGNRAFVGCESLETVDTSRVYAMGAQVFKDCINLKHIDITALRNAGKEVFLNCTSLESVDNGIFTKFSESMFKNSGLKSITFNADRIPNNCFENCGNLESVKITRNIVYVGNEAFSNCTSLREVTFEDNAGAEFIYEKAFNNCINLEKVVLPNSKVEIEQEVFSGCNKLSQVVFNKDTYLNDSLGSIFSGCESLTSFVVNEENSNYQTNGNLLLSKDGKAIILAAPGFVYGEYTVPTTIERIETSAFSGINSLTKLILLDNVLEVGKLAFANCESLVEITLSNNVVLKDKAFMNSNSLSSIINIGTIKEFSPYVFANTAITSLVLDNVIIGEGSFMGCKELTTIDVTSSKIGDYAFAECSLLESVKTNVEEVGSHSFENCVKLNSLEFENITKIGDYGFKGCIALTSVNFTNVEYVGAYAFADCISLADANLNSVKVIGDYAFSTTTKDKGNSLINVNFSLVEQIGEYAFYKSYDLVKVELGENLTKVGKFAFSECTSLESFNTKSSLETVPEAMFAEDNALVTVEINNINYIEAAAFINCISLQNINLSEVITIGMQAFNNCLGLTNVNLENAEVLEAGALLECANLTQVNMPKMKRLEAQSLSCIGVTEIVIPSTIEYIAPTTFYYNQNQTKFVNSNNSDTCVVNNYVRLDQGVLYTVTENDKYLLSSYPVAKPESTYNVLFNTIRIEEYAGYFNKKLEILVFPDTLKLIGNMSFYGCTNLNTVEFRSTVAPVLEGTVSALDISYDTKSEIYQFLNKYFQFNGYYPLYYGQFKDMVGKSTKMNIIVPKNVESGYDDKVYSLFFDLDKITYSDYVALNARSIDYLNKVVLVPSEVTLNDGSVIESARTAYNLLNQDLTEYGYEKSYLDNLYNNLVQAEKSFKEIKMNRINKVYGFLIKEISDLGSVYKFEKISDYYNIINRLDIVNREDKLYIDTTNVDEFKKGFDEYFKDLNEDINTIVDITTLPTSLVNKVGIVVATSLAAGIVLFFTLRKRKFM